MSTNSSGIMLTAVIAAAAGAVIASESTSRSHTADNAISPSQLLNLADFKSIFRLRQREFRAIYRHLRLPVDIETASRDCVDSETGLLLVLGFLGGSRLITLARTFGRSTGACSRIIGATTAAIEQRWASLLDIRRAHTHLLTPQHLKRYARCTAKQECPLAGLWGFMDGTVRPIARPVRGQRQYYSGHKRVHGIKFQVVIAVDGLLWIHGPHEGRRNDSFMLADSGLHDWLDEHSMDEKGKDLFLFADKAYAPRGHLVIPYKGLFVTKEQKRFNLRMSTHRVAVEWAIGSVPTLFPRFEIKRLQRSLQADLPKLYRCAVLLRNALSCLAGNTTSQTFQCDPPSLSEYFDVTIL